MSGCRILKVTDKATGRTLHVLPAPEMDHMASRLLRCARELVEMDWPGGITGYAIVVFGKDGTFSRGCRLTNESPFGVTLLPAAVAEVLRRDTADDVVEDALVRNGFINPSDGPA